MEDVRNHIFLKKIVMVLLFVSLRWRHHRPPFVPDALRPSPKGASPVVLKTERLVKVKGRPL